MGTSILQIRIPETLSEDILTKMHAPPKPDYPIITPQELPGFDAYLFGIPTRYGNFPAQWKVSCSLLCSPRMQLSNEFIFQFSKRHFGMLPVVFGAQVPSQENTLVSLSLQELLVEGKV